MRLVGNIAAIPMVVLVHIGATALVARVLGSKVYEITFGFGPILYRRAMQRTFLTLRTVPLGGSVGLEPPDGIGSVAGSPGGRPFADLGGLARAVVYSAGSVATLALAMVLLGGSVAGTSFGRGFGQFIGGAIAPSDQGVRNLRVFGNVLASASFPACAGVIAAKMAAFNLIPLPSLNGFHILCALLLGQRRPGWLVWALNGGAMLLFLALASYGVAALMILWHR
jgi:membrane-associated protease RseP (regulator of RpoE activity)